VLFPLEYRADAQVLISSVSRYGVDPYTAIKSAERVGENVAQIMRTGDFYTKVRGVEGSGFDWSEFDRLSEREKRKKWEQSISPSIVYGTGVLSVSAFHGDANQALALSRAVLSTLETRSVDYVGGDVTIRVVNAPVVTPWPVRPNLFINAVLGFIFGSLLMGFLVVRRK
jgi:capsular polysaccharide biosynthesis protein